MTDYSNPTDDEVSDLYDSGLGKDKQKAIQDQLRQAQILRANRNANFDPLVTAGNAHMPNVFGALANGILNYKAGKEISGLQDSSRNLDSSMHRGAVFAGLGSAAARDQARIAPPDVTDATVQNTAGPIAMDTSVPDISALVSALKTPKKQSAASTMTPDEFEAMVKRKQAPTLIEQ